jgi:hypothetical protein
MLKLWAPASARGTAAARCRLRIATDLATFPIDALAGEAILPAGVKHVYHGPPLTTGAIGRKAVQVTNAGRATLEKTRTCQVCWTETAAEQNSGKRDNESHRC